MGAWDDFIIFLIMMLLQCLRQAVFDESTIIMIKLLYSSQEMT